jgi:hypothetical protein
MGDIMGERSSAPSRSARSVQVCENSIRGQGTEWPATVTRHFNLLHPRQENVLIVMESDWLRIERMVEELVPHTSAYQVAASISSGTLVSFICFWLSLELSAAPIPSWAWIVDISVICCSVLMSVLCFLFDSRMKTYTVCRTRDVLRELEDQLAEFRARRFAPNGNMFAGQPFPIQFEFGPMPAHDGVGLKRSKAFRHPGHSRRKVSQKKRSREVNRGFAWLRATVASCWRSARFSKMRSRRD